MLLLVFSPGDRRIMGSSTRHSHEVVKPYLSETASDFIHFLRALSSQTVVIGHGLALFYFTSNEVLLALPSLAVMVFFVLSGFVIAYSTGLKGRQYGFTRYFFDRFARIYSALVPALFFFALCGGLYFLFAGELPFSLDWKYFFSNLLMLPENPVLERIQYMLPPEESWRFLGFFGGNKPLWSLSLEWWFYIFFGAVFYWRQSGRSKYLWLLLSIPFALGYAVLPGRAGWGLSFIWMSGTIIHYMLSKGISIRFKGVTFWLLLLVTAVLISGFTLWAILAIIPLIYVGIDEFNRRSHPAMSRFFKLFKWPANYSYSIYILHYPLLLIALELDSIDPVLACLFAIVSSNVIAAIFYIYIESKYKIISNWLKSNWA